MKTYMRDEFAMRDRIKELETLNAELLAALKVCRHCAVQLEEREAYNLADTAIAKAEQEK